MPVVIGLKAEKHPGQVTSLSQGRQTHDCGRKSEHLGETRADMRTACKLHNERTYRYPDREQSQDPHTVRHNPLCHHAASSITVKDVSIHASVFNYLAYY